MGQVLFHCLPLISCCSLNRRPHGRKFSITNDRRDLELNPKPLDPRTQVRPHLADVAGDGDGNTTTADRLTNAVFQFKPSKRSPGAPALMYSANPGQDSQAPSTVGNDQTIR